MSEKVVTFSIAAYNIEETVKKCLESVLDCGLNDEAEILVINDGSSDRTADIVLEYEKKYPGTVRLINKENGGHGSTINTAIKEAKGKYLRAIDGDDRLNTEAAKEYIKRLRSEDADIVLCNHESHFEDGRVSFARYKGLKDNRTYTFSEIAKKTDWMNYHSVTYKTKILVDNDIKLDEHCFYVDTEFMVLPIPHVNSVTYYDLSVYCYSRGVEGQSVSEQSRIKNILHSKKVAVRIIRFLKATEPSLDEDKKKYLQGLVAGHCIWHFKGLVYFAPDEEKRKDLIRFERYVKKMSPEVFDLMTVPATNRHEQDIKTVRHIRKFDYKTYNLYGMYRKTKKKGKEIIKTILGK